MVSIRFSIIKLSLRLEILNPRIFKIHPCILNTDGMEGLFAVGAGLFSLAMVLVVATNLRLLIENFLKYGLLLGKGVVVSGALRSVAPTNNPALLACWPALLLLCLLIFAWERFGAWKVMKDVKVRSADEDEGEQLLRSLLEVVVGLFSCSNLGKLTILREIERACVNVQIHPPSLDFKPIRSEQCNTSLTISQMPPSSS